MEDGFYAVKNGEVFKIDPRIKMPIAKSVNVKTGEIHYPSNADRIRSMSDEELAGWIDNDVAFWGKWCPNDAPINPVTHECMRNGGECKLCILDWLKEEAKDV